MKFRKLVAALAVPVEAAAAVLTGKPQVIPQPEAAPQPHVLLKAGRHVIDGVTIDIPADPARDLIVWPLPRWGRYIVDSKITYVHDPRAGIRIEW